MNVQKYLNGRGEQKKQVLRNDMAKLNFTVNEIVQMQMTRANYEKLDIHHRKPGTSQTLHKRMADVGNAWCVEHCHDGWAKMRFPGTWCFENAAEALMFRLAFS